MSSVVVDVKLDNGTHTEIISGPYPHNTGAVSTQHWQLVCQGLVGSCLTLTITQNYTP